MQLAFFVSLLLFVVVFACNDLDSFASHCATGLLYCVSNEQGESLYSSCFDSAKRAPLFVTHKIVRDRCKEGKRCKGSWHVFSPPDNHLSHDQLVHLQGSGAAFANQAFQV